MICNLIFQQIHAIKWIKYTWNYMNQLPQCKKKSIEVYFSFSFVILDATTKVTKVHNKSICFSWWQAFIIYRSGSSGLKKNVLTFWFYLENYCILYNIILLFCLEFEVLVFFTSTVDMHFIYVFILFYFNFLFLFYFEPYEAQMFQWRVQILLINLLKHRCYGAEVIYFVLISEIEKRTIPQM